MTDKPFAREAKLFDFKGGEFQQSADAPAVTRLPDFVSLDVEDCNRLGQRHYLNGDFPRAEECFLAVVKADPNHAFGWGNLGLIWYHNSFFDDALKCFLRSHELNPNNPQNITNMGCLHDRVLMQEHAERLYLRALELDPRNARATSNLGHLYLKQFKFREGWPLMEKRFHTVPKQSKMRDYPTIPLWNGLPVQKLLVWPEMGVGDQIVNTTVLGDLARIGQPFVCELDPRLVPIYQRSYPEWKFIARGDPFSHLGCDAHVPLMTLAGILRPSIESFAVPPLKLRPDQHRKLSLLEKMGVDGRRVAISWRSFHAAFNIEAQTRKSANLADFEELGRRSDLQLVTVQYGDVQKELDAWEWNHIHRPDVDLFNDIDGVMAAIDACDLVVTTSNVTAHFAGALGKPTYLVYLRGSPPFYYWQPDEYRRSLWYPSVQIVSGPNVTTFKEAIHLVSEML